MKDNFSSTFYNLLKYSFPTSTFEIKPGLVMVKALNLIDQVKIRPLEKSVSKYEKKAKWQRRLKRKHEEETLKHPEYEAELL